jgi:hypothetical protein
MRLILMLAAAVALGTAAPALAGPKGCPPGLAKKSPACVPPGHANKGGRDYDYDDDRRVTREVVRERYYITDYDYVPLRDPGRYTLPPLQPGEAYYVANNQVYRVDTGTRQILDVLGVVSGLLN